MSDHRSVLRYARWQAFDFLVERAAAMAIILALFLYLAHIAISQSARMPGDEPSPGMLATLGPMMLKNLLGTTWIVMGLLTANGICANDRVTGRFRFLFSKPVRVEALYAQAFAVNVVLGTACLATAVLILCSWTRAPSALVQVSLLITLSGVAGISGLCFLFSAVWRFDWLATVGIWAAVSILYVKFPNAGWLKYLPPTNAVGDQIERFGTAVPIDAAPLFWFLSFGMMCFIAGLVILRRRPLST